MVSYTKDKAAVLGGSGQGRGRGSIRSTCPHENMMTVM